MENELDRDQKLAGYCYGIQEGTANEWNKMWDLYTKVSYSRSNQTPYQLFPGSKHPESFRNIFLFWVD